MEKQEKKPLRQVFTYFQCLFFLFKLESVTFHLKNHYIGVGRKWQLSDKNIERRKNSKISIVEKISEKS